VKEQQKTAAKKKIKTVIDKLHSEGLVHGDLHATNILIADMKTLTFKSSVVLIYGQVIESL
jgi:tRNA A-37 threonylcarbamoyl transferase component Bud32